VIGWCHRDESPRERSGLVLQLDFVEGLSFGIEFCWYGDSSTKYPFADIGGVW
jgi:hypothetical protein